MKTISEETTENILKAARKEFLEYGFSEASLRRISSASDVSTHTIYTRFGDKEGLFDALVKKTADDLFAIYQDSVNRSHTSDYHDSYEQGEEGSHAMLKYIYQHFDDVKLIISRSKGCKYEHYLDRFVEVEEKSYEFFLQNIPNLKKKVNGYFFHVLSKRSFSSFNEIVDNNMSYEEAKDYLETMIEFDLGGLNRVLGIKED